MRRRTSKLRAFFTLLASMLLVFVTAAPALAEEMEFSYEYTIRVFPGNRGTLPNGDPSVAKKPKGGSINLYDLATATITDEKYVQIGFRLSGQDTLIGGSGIINGKTVIDGKVVDEGITEDMDFVVAYGVKANSVEYTLHYVEYGTGKVLAEPKTFYGRAGDKPVVAYEYIEGYRPLYLAITGTLQAGEPNDWTFEYVVDEGGQISGGTSTTTEGETTVVPGTTTTVVNEIPGQTTINYVDVPGTNTENVVTEPGTTTTNVTEVPGSTNTTVVPGTTTETVTAGPTTESTAGAQTTAPAGGETGGNEGAEGTTTQTNAEQPAPPATREILDLDTPLAGPGSSNGQAGAEKGSNLLTNPWSIGMLAAILVACCGILFYLANRKKKDEEDDEAEEA